MIRLYIIGLAILIVAIFANGIVMELGIKTWYDLLEILTRNGTSAFNKINLLDYLWLFIAYPLILGFGYWIGDKFHHLLFS